MGLFLLYSFFLILKAEIFLLFPTRRFSVGTRYLRLVYFRYSGYQFCTDAITEYFAKFANWIAESVNYKIVTCRRNEENFNVRHEIGKIGVHLLICCTGENSPEDRTDTAFTHRILWWLQKE
jgi:hypothetical protein